MTMIDTFNW